MITGIGLDLVEMKRIERLRQKQARFPQRILTEAELDVYLTLNEKRQTEFLAGRFAAKEAYQKREELVLAKNYLSKILKSWRMIMESHIL